MLPQQEQIAVERTVQSCPRQISPPAARTNFTRVLSRERARSSAAFGVLRIFAFFAFFASVLFATDWAVTRGLRKIDTSDFGVTNRIVSGTANADIVISGSSRALTHYDPRIIERVTGYRTLNIGRNGSQTDMQLAVLKTYLKNNAKPKLVIHNLDLFSFLTTREIFDPGQYLPYLSEPAIYDGIKRIYPDAWKWKYLPLYGYVVEDMRFAWLLGLKRWLGMQPQEDHFQGFIPRHSAWTGDFEKFRDSNQEGVTFAIEPQGVRDLTAIAQVCREQGIPLLLVYSPVYAEMRALEMNRADVFAKFYEISQRFGLPLWDYSDSPISLNRSYFYNSQHLNAEGAADFSLELATRLRAERTTNTSSGPTRSPPRE